MTTDEVLACIQPGEWVRSGEVKRRIAAGSHAVSDRLNAAYAARRLERRSVPRGPGQRVTAWEYRIAERPHGR